MAQVVHLEELTLNALPALRVLHYDGWLLCQSEGFTRRANSVQSLYPGVLPLEEKIAVCEQVYSEAGMPTVFKLVEGASSPALDRALDARGYQRSGDTFVQTASLAHLPPASGDSWAVFDGFLTPAWLEDFARLRPLDDHERSVFTRMQMQLALRTCYVRLLVEGDSIGVALGVLERGWLGIYDVIIAPRWRGKGYGRQMLLRLMAWAAAQGARQAYLQVMASNLPALALYAALGFTRAHTYCYRQPPPLR
jgi:ribosomal protein S18 acetylase RimI-like enzyme